MFLQVNSCCEKLFCYSSALNICDVHCTVYMYVCTACMMCACTDYRVIKRFVVLCIVDAGSAIHTKPGGESRVPTDLWAGCGFSRSMPDADLRLRLSQRACRLQGDTVPFEVQHLCVLSLLI